jgi:hypothetical protein
MKNKRTPEPDLAPVADSGEAAESGQQAGQRTQTAS